MIPKTGNDNGRHRLVITSMKQSFNTILRWDCNRWLTLGCGRIYFPVFARREDCLPALRNVENIIIVRETREILSPLYFPSRWIVWILLLFIQRLEFNGFLFDLNYIISNAILYTPLSTHLSTNADIRFAHIFFQIIRRVILKFILLNHYFQIE